MIDLKKFFKGIKLLNNSDTTKKVTLEVQDAYTGDLTVRFPAESATQTMLTDSATQTVTNKSIDADANTITNIDNADIKAGAAIDATKIADGSVSNTEFQYLGGVTSDIQTQLNSKASGTDLTNHTSASSDVHGVGVGNAVVGTGTTQTLTNKSIDADSNTITNIDNNDIKASAGIDATKIADGSVDNTEFQYLNGVTSAIQTQLDSKIDTVGPVGASPNANGASISGDTLTLQPASGTQPGVMLAGAQTLGGAKSWTGDQNLQAAIEFDSVATPSNTGSDVTLSLPSKTVSVLADPALDSVAGITGASNARMVFFANKSGENIVWRNNSGSASVGNRLNTGGSDFTQPDGTSVQFVYDTANAVWILVKAGEGVTGILPIANGGTNSGTALNNNRVMQSSSGAIVEAAAITASRALISDANGIPTHSSVTSTELGYVSGVTSAIQTQLGTKVTNPMTTNGDTIYGGASGTPTRLAAGYQGAILKINSSGVPAWGVFNGTEYSSNVTVDDGVDYFYINTGGAPRTITLPPLSSNRGRRLVAIRSGSGFNAGTIQRQGSDQILYNNNLYTSVTANTQGETWILEAGGDYWVVTGRVTETPWTSYTPTLNSNTGVSSNNGYWRRVGDSIELRVQVIYNGVGNNSQFTASLPSGLIVDTGKVQVNSTISLGYGQWFDNGVGWYSMTVNPASTTNMSLNVHAGGTFFNTSSTANLDTLSFFTTLPISGWFA